MDSVSTNSNHHNPSILLQIVKDDFIRTVYAVVPFLFGWTAIIINGMPNKQMNAFLFGFG